MGSGMRPLKRGKGFKLFILFGLFLFIFVSWGEGFFVCFALGSRGALEGGRCAGPSGMSKAWVVVLDLLPASQLGSLVRRLCKAGLLFHVSGKREILNSDTNSVFSLKHCWSGLTAPFFTFIFIFFCLIIIFFSSAAFWRAWSSVGRIPSVTDSIFLMKAAALPWAFLLSWWELQLILPFAILWIVFY